MLKSRVVEIDLSGDDEAVKGTEKEVKEGCRCSNCGCKEKMYASSGYEEPGLVTVQYEDPRIVISGKHKSLWDNK